MFEMRNYDGIPPFRFRVLHLRIEKDTELVDFAPHVHSECEIYINLSGKVSFLVENKIYPVSRGSVIITRPNEFHYCIYHDREETHDHFWYLFSLPEKSGILERFYNRKKGENNLIELNEVQLVMVEKISSVLENENIDDLEFYYNFLKLIKILNDSDNKYGDALRDGSGVIDQERKQEFYPEVLFAIDYIQNNFKTSITISEIARMANININSFEKKFKANIGVTPSNFIKTRRLIEASSLLKKGYSVQKTLEAVGYTDTSRFIAEFKKKYNVTPLQYQKNFKKNGF